MTSASENVYIHKSYDIINEYNNTYVRKIKMNSVDIKDNTYIYTGKEVNNKEDLNFKLVIM